MAAAESASDEAELFVTPEGCSGARRATGSRSSARLRDKASKTFRLPSREELLEDVSPGNRSYTESAVRKFKPRNLVNNFLRERSTYVTERSYEVDSNDEDLSDFIDDDEEDEGYNHNASSDEKSSSGNATGGQKNKRTRGAQIASSESDASDGSKIEKRGRTFRKKKNKVSSTSKRTNGHISRRKCGKISSSESDVSDGSKIGKQGRPSRKKKKVSSTPERTNGHISRRKHATISSSEGDSSDNSDSVEMKTSTRKKRKISSSSSDNERPGKDNVNNERHKKASCTPGSHTRPRSTRVRNLASKHQRKNEVLESLLIKRKAARLEPNERLVMKQEESKTDSGEEEAFGSSWFMADCSEDEDDKAFVVPDEAVTDGKPGDAETFMDVLGIKPELPNEAKVLESMKARVRWHRITQQDSDEGEEDLDKCSTGIIAAVLKDDEQALKALIDEDPNCINVTYKNKTALHFAAAKGNANLVKCLLTLGADTGIYDGNHLPAVAYAANSNPDCLELILKHTDQSLAKISKHMSRNGRGLSLLHLAVSGTSESQGRCLQLLFEQDRKACEELLDSRDHQGFTPLVHAVCAHQHQCVQALLEKGAMPHQFQTDDRGNLLHFAVANASSHMQGDHQDVSLCLRQLLPHMKLEIDKLDENGFTPLMYACESGNETCAAALLENGASVSVSDSYGTSSLHLAAMSGSTECVQLLLAHGHQVDCLDRHGWPPLLYANFQAHESCVLALMEPKPEQLFVLGNLLRKAKNVVDKEKTLTVVRNVLVSLANHDAYYTLFNNFLRAHPEVLDAHSLLEGSWRGIVDYDNKCRWFRTKLNQIRAPRSCADSLTLVADRENVLASAMSQLGHVLPHVFREKTLHVTFKDEPGICLGPKKEFFGCLCKDVAGAGKSLFTVADDSQYSPFPNAYFAKFTEGQEGCSAPGATPSTAGTGADCARPDSSDEELLAAATEVESRVQPPERADGDHKQANASSDGPKSSRASQDSKGVWAVSLRLKLKQMRFIGRMVGFAICDDMLLDLPLSEPFVKQVLGIPLSHPADLSSFDHELHKNAVTWVQENSVSELDLPFSVDVINPWTKKPVTVMLCEDPDRLVSDENKDSYVRLVSQFILETSIADEVAEFTRGLGEVIPRNLLALFTADEFSLLMNGVCSIDVEDWKSNTQYRGFSADDDVIKWLWSAVSRLKQEEKALLLKFCTGSPCVPVGGFAALQGMLGTGLFTVVHVEGMNKIPMASTCFNMLKLSGYDSDVQLREKLLVAIRHGAEGFSFS